MRRKRLLLHAVAAVAVTASFVQAQVVYQNDSFVSGTFSAFNNSQGTETENNWVANSFQVIAGGTRLTSYTFLTGLATTNRAITLAIYLGSSLTNPQAGGGLTRVATTNTTYSATANTFVTVALSSPFSLSIGDVFYAAVLLQGVAGSAFPWASDDASSGNPVALGRSFFDVGATQGAAYDLDVTSRAVVLGGTHTVVGGGVQGAGNLILRVNADTVPEPGTVALVGMGIAGLLLAHRRRAARAANV